MQVDNEPSIGEDSFVWLASLVPLLGDIVNGRFTYETLTAPTANRIHFPAYDKYLKEVDKYCISLSLSLSGFGTRNTAKLRLKF